MKSLARLSDLFRSVCKCILYFHQQCYMFSSSNILVGNSRKLWNFLHNDMKKNRTKMFLHTTLGYMLNGKWNLCFLSDDNILWREIFDFVSKTTLSYNCNLVGDFAKQIKSDYKKIIKEMNLHLLNPILIIDRYKG